MKSLFNRPAAALVAAGLAWGAAGNALAQAPNFPAAPLAGGNAAAAGGTFMNVHGDSIVMPASYCEPAGGYGGDAYGAMCPDDGYGGGYGNCAGADFGGASYPDQCGPHYFDLYVGTVALTRDDAFEDVPPLGSIGIGGPLILDPQAWDDYEFGWEIAARYDVGALSVLEAKYMGIYNFGFEQQVRSVDVAPGNTDFQLQTVFSNYGLNPIDGLDQGSVYTVDFESDLQSTELSYRRYWVGYNPRVSGTYLAGFRYVRMTEDLTFDADALLGNSHLDWSADNDLVGGQIGGDGWIALRQGLRLGVDGKAGIYNNRYEFRHVTDIADATVTDANLFADGNQVAFVGETSVDLVADILPSFSIRGGYRVLYMSSLVTVGNNIDRMDVASEALYTQADALYHGFHGGIEYIW